MPRVAPDIKELLKKHKLTKNDVWDCHGTWVVYHKSIEKIQRAEKIVILDLNLEYIDLALGSCVVKCTAVKDGFKVITFGECNPKNNRNSYPVAMAEKRSMDRAILKLAGMHGDFYSEDEMGVSQQTTSLEKKNKPGNNQGRSTNRNIKDDTPFDGNGSPHIKKYVEMFSKIKTDTERKDYVLARIKEVRNTHMGNLLEAVSPYQKFIEHGKFSSEITKAFNEKKKELEQFEKGKAA